MIIGLGDDRPCDGCAGADKRRRRALAHLARAHASGALGELAGASGVEGLGDLDPNVWFPDRVDIDREADAFDARINAWMVDLEAKQGVIPASFSQQIDDFVNRWRALHDSWYVVGRSRVSDILAMQSEWNRIRDQAASYGAATSIAAATVTVDGKAVRADEIPAGSSTFDRVETLVKWGAILAGSAAAYKVASDLGLFKRLGGLIGSRGGVG